MVLLVCFIAYSAQVRYRPFLSPEERFEVLRDHAYKAQTDSVHMRLELMLKEAEASGPKVSRKVALGARNASGGYVTAAAVLGYLFNYNTVEMILLFCCCLIALCGIMFESGQLQPYAFNSQKYSVTVFIVFVIMGSVAYCTLLPSVRVCA